MGVLSKLYIKPLEKNLICDFAHIHASFIQHGEDAFMLLFHQINNDLVIEIINLKKTQITKNIYKRSSVMHSFIVIVF